MRASVTAVTGPNNKVSNSAVMRLARSADHVPRDRSGRARQ